MISKKEFQEWKSHPVTEEFFSALKEQLDKSVETLVCNTGNQGLPDDYLRGYIIALRDVLESEIDDKQEDQQEYD